MKTRKQLQLENGKLQTLINELQIRLTAAGSEGRKALRKKLEEQTKLITTIQNKITELEITVTTLKERAKETA